MAKKCPNCDILNPDSAVLCDCRYDFGLSEIRPPDPVDPVVPASGAASSRPKIRDKCPCCMQATLYSYGTALRCPRCSTRFVTDEFAARPEVAEWQAYGNRKVYGTLTLGLLLGAAGILIGLVELVSGVQLATEGRDELPHPIAFVLVGIPFLVASAGGLLYYSRLQEKLNVRPIDVLVTRVEVIEMPPFRMTNAHWGAMVAVGVYLLFCFGVAYWIDTHPEVFMVNALETKVRIRLGAEELEVEPRSVAKRRFARGKWDLEAINYSGEYVDRVSLDVQTSGVTTVWNIAGAAPVFAQTIRYGDIKNLPESDAPVYYCDKKVIAVKGINYAFREPPRTLTNRGSSRDISRGYLDVLQPIKSCRELRRERE